MPGARHLVMFIDTKYREWLAGSPVEVGACAGGTIGSEEGWTVYADPASGRKWKWHEATGQAAWVDTPV